MPSSAIAHHLPLLLLIPRALHARISRRLLREKHQEKEASHSRPQTAQTSPGGSRPDTPASSHSRVFEAVEGISDNICRSSSYVLIRIFQLGAKRFRVN